MSTVRPDTQQEPGAGTPEARYFKSPTTGAIWRFRGDEAHIRGGISANRWVASVCGIEDMDGKVEIGAGEGEP
jgi:hypothetical protein